jgi:hypothetical protein
VSVLRSVASLTAILVIGSGCTVVRTEGTPPAESDVTSVTQATTSTVVPTTITTTTITTTTITTTTTTMVPTTSIATTSTAAPSTTASTTASTTSTTTAASTTVPSPSTSAPETDDPDTDPDVDPDTDPDAEVETPGLDVYDPACVVSARRGDTFVRIARLVDNESPDSEGLRIENGVLIGPPARGQLLDVCVGNGIDDITGETRGDPGEAIRQRAVIRQQEKLNGLFEGYGIRELLVDGVSGPVTRQRLCAFRLSHGLPVTLTDMEAGSDEEKILMSATDLLVPANEAVLAPRWILIDRTCQIMFTGEGFERLVYVFATSTGSEGYETRLQNRTAAFRFNPATDNGGWHNSSLYPVEEDNPLNGNMYKPLYFDNGQAIHGAGNVPTSPASKGCARLRVENQDMLVDWLGLTDSGPTSSPSRLGVAVSVQGTWG